VRFVFIKAFHGYHQILNGPIIKEKKDSLASNEVPLPLDRLLQVNSMFSIDLP
jgi:hypothetical protein